VTTSVPVRWVAPLTEAVVLKRLVLAVALVPVAGWVFLVWGQGLLALLAMALVAWPLPLRATVSETGIRFRVGLIEQVVPLPAVSSAYVLRDPRPLAIWRRFALVVRRHNVRPLVVFSDHQSLVELQRQIVAALAPAEVPERAPTAKRRY
jgi:hypothetical protein